MNRVAVFASGSGTNCENLIRYFENSENIDVGLVITNNPFAGVIERAWQLDVDCYINLFSSSEDLQTLNKILNEYKIDWIVLAGFLKLIPADLIERFKGRIINIHPALLPKYAGKGMYGMNVHKEVIESGDTISGITIHLVNEQYDKGQILVQHTCEVLPDDTPEILAERIHQLEYRYFPVEVETYILHISTT